MFHCFENMFGIALIDQMTKGMLYKIHYMTKSMWTPAIRTSNSKIMDINMELVPPLLL